MGKTEQRPEAILSTLDKGLHILEVLTGEHSARGLTLTELSHVLGMHRTTLFRFLATLHARGYIDRDAATDRYRLGARTLMLASTFLSNLDIRQVARPILQALRDQTQELVHLTMLDQGDVVTIDRFEGKQPLSMQTEVGARRPAYCLAAGKAFLAYLTPPEVDRILARGMPALTPRTITSPAVLHEHLAEVRRRGFAIDDAEWIDGVRCVAAPVFDHSGSIVGAVSMAAPSVRMPLDRLWQVGEEVRTAAEAISRRLGSSPLPADATGAAQEAPRGLADVHAQRHPVGRAGGRGGGEQGGERVR